MNALIAVGAFIAGVQAQIIGIASSGSKDTSLGRATNWLAFIGLTLDLIGTSTGVARALLLQAAIRRTHRLAVRLTGQIDGARHELSELLRRHSSNSNNSSEGTSEFESESKSDPTADARARALVTRSVPAISRVMALLAQDGRFGVQTAENITEIEEAGAAVLNALGSGSTRASPAHGLTNAGAWRRRVGSIRATMFWDFVLPHMHVQGLGHIPVASLAGGALGLLATVALLAASSQQRGVWISCTTIAVNTLTFAALPTTNAHTRKRSVLYDQVEEMLDICPPVEPPVYHGKDLDTLPPKEEDV